MQRKLNKVIQGQTVAHTTPTATVAQAASLMRQRGIGALPVLVGADLVGIFTERDALFRVIAEGRDAAHTRVGDVMTRDPVCVEGEDTVRHAVRIMRETGCRHLPITDAGRLSGVVSFRDVLVSLLEQKDHEIQDLKEYFEYLPPEAGPGG